MNILKGKRVLIIVENLPSPFDRRVWQEANALVEEGAEVTIICPTGKGYEKRHEVINDIEIFRHPLPEEGRGLFGYMREYTCALFWEFYLSLKVFFGRGFDIIHACNPPDLIFLVALPYMVLGKKFIFDHHDINPELYIGKFGKKGVFYKLLLFVEWCTFKCATISIATNESYKEIAVRRGGMNPEKVHVVRSGPSLERLKQIPPVAKYRNGRKYLVGYVGVIGKQEGLQYLVDAAYHLIHEKKRGDIQFVCVGGGTDLETVKSYASDRNVAEYFQFTGRASDQVLLEALNTADVCVNPDEFNEMNDKSTMNKIMEYMALKKPIVQFDLKEGRFSAQKASLYAEANNAKDMAEKILCLLENPDLRNEMGEFGYKRVVNELEWEHEKPKLLAAYESI